MLVPSKYVSINFSQYVFTHEMVPKDAAEREENRLAAKWRGTRASAALVEKAAAHKVQHLA